MKINKSMTFFFVVSMLVLLPGLGIYRRMADTGGKNLQIEIFDIGKGCVVKAVQLNDDALSEAKKYLHEITGVYLKAKALPDKGYIIKIPFSPSIEVKNQWLNGHNINSLDKVFIIFPEEGTSYLLVLDSKERPYFYFFKGDTGKLLRSLNFNPVT